MTQTSAISGTQATAADYAARLRANAQRYHDREVDHETFSDANAALWTAIQARGEAFDDEVLAILRRDREAR